MKREIVVSLIIILMITNIYSSTSDSLKMEINKKRPSILGQLFVAEFGNVLGYIGGKIIVSTSVNAGIIKFKSKRKENKANALSMSFLGAFSSSYAIKYLTKSDRNTYIKTAFFSVVPLILHLIIRKPTFRPTYYFEESSGMDDKGYAWISFLVVPIVSVSANNYFLNKQKQNTKQSDFKLVFINQFYLSKRMIYLNLFEARF